MAASCFSGKTIYNISGWRKELLDHGRRKLLRHGLFLLAAGSLMAGEAGRLYLIAGIGAVAELCTPFDVRLESINAAYFLAKATWIFFEAAFGLYERVGLFSALLLLSQCLLIRLHGTTERAFCLGLEELLHAEEAKSVKAGQSTTFDHYLEALVAMRICPTLPLLILTFFKVLRLLRALSCLARWVLMLFFDPILLLIADFLRLTLIFLHNFFLR